MRQALWILTAALAALAASVCAQEQRDPIGVGESPASPQAQTTPGMASAPSAEPPQVPTAVPAPAKTRRVRGRKAARKPKPAVLPVSARPPQDPLPKVPLTPFLPDNP